MMTVWKVYEVFYSWFNWQGLQVNFKCHLSHDLLAQSHNPPIPKLLDPFPTVLLLLHAFIASESSHWDWDQYRLSLFDSIPAQKGAEKWRWTQGLVRSLDMVNVEAFSIKL